MRRSSAGTIDLLRRGLRCTAGGDSGVGFLGSGRNDGLQGIGTTETAAGALLTRGLTGHGNSDVASSDGVYAVARVALSKAFNGRICQGE